MKRLMILFITTYGLIVYAQYKETGFPTSDIRDGIISNNSGNLFGFLNSEDFSMKHSYSMSYSSFGNQGLALGVYTNSMFYKLANNLNVQLDASFIHSPYSTFGKEFEKNISGFYISRAAVNYKPWEDVSISIQYRNLPYTYYNPYGFYRGWNYDPFFGSDDFFSR
jgi:hypothetical protein